MQTTLKPLQTTLTMMMAALSTQYWEPGMDRDDELIFKMTKGDGGPIQTARSIYITAVPLRCI